MNTYTLDTCHTAAGVVVVIDVIRAFTTAAYAFAAGAERILLAGTVEEALALRDRFPGSLIMGESGGQRVESFDMWNSPEEISHLDLSGRTIVQRTSSGTQGAVRSTNAAHLLASSFVVAEATVRLMRRSASEPVGYVATGVRDGIGGVEDIALAEYLSARLNGENPDPKPYLDQVRLDPRWISQDPEVIAQVEKDLARCLEINRFSFGLEVQRQDNLLVLKAVETDE